jgi:tRNA A-37 threonylcarbamoyl transferase component Bud32
MQRLSVPTLLDEITSALDESTAQLPANIIKKAEEIPRVISRLHALGYAHSDLHSGNIAFDPRDPQRPIVIDFGRTVHLNSTFSNPDEAAEFRIFDYMVPLDSFVGKDEDAITVHNAVLRATHLDWGMLREIFSPITSENAVERKKLIRRVMFTKAFRNETATSFNIVEL